MKTIVVIAAGAFLGTMLLLARELGRYCDDVCGWRHDEEEDE